MKDTRKKWLLISMGSILTLTLMLSVGAGIGVSQDAYVVGEVSFSPSATACIGGTVIMSGGGAASGGTVALSMVHSPGEFPSSTFGSTTADSAGIWSLTTTVPTMGMSGKGTSTPILAGNYSVMATGADASGMLAVKDLSLIH